MELKTKIITAGRDKKWTNGVVNTPVVRASTVIFDSMKDLKYAGINRTKGELYYGRRGTQTAFSFTEAIAKLEGGDGTCLYPSGTAAITSSLLSFLQAGDHILVVDTVYEPTRVFCDQVLTKLNISTTYYDPMIGEEIKDLIQPNTKILYLESPGSITMEIQNVPLLAEIAHANNLLVMLDNTWASPILSNPFMMGVDISIQAATKYIVGHSDVMLGTSTAKDEYLETLREQSYLLGHCTSPDDIYLAARGLKTLDLRLKQHEANALTVANWLLEQPEVLTLLHPAFESCKGHEFFLRDFTGSNGLFSFILKPTTKAAVCNFVDNMRYFKLGFSWGGFESLIMPTFDFSEIRTATKWDPEKFVIRLHIGLEDPIDLIEDLKQGFKRMHL